MRVLYVTAEAFPLAKTGGLADVSAALPSALKDLGIDVQLLLPGYPRALACAPPPERIVRLGDPLGYGDTRLLQTRLPHTDIPVWLVDCPSLYDRDGGLYQDESGADWPDNALRFGLLSHAAVGIAAETGGRWRPDVIHANDWHAGLTPLLLQSTPSRPATVLTIHNLAYQGLFSAGDLARLGLPDDTFSAVEFYGRISFLKAGISSADALTTVSPTYATEILSPEAGCGLDGLLRSNASRLTGILNGVDYAIWDPATDPHLACNYSSRSMAGKAECKRTIQIELGLDQVSDAPLMAFMSRLVHQKMPDVVLEVLPPLIEEGMQFVLVAQGENGYQDAFRRLAEQYPGRIAVRIGYEEALAHRVLAGADILVHPSRFEPCGLVPIYALRYGAVPIVRRSGGMADTVSDASMEAIRDGTATGFAFADPTAQSLEACVRRALSLYRQPIAWRRLQSTAMRQDFGWERSAEAYAKLYRSLLPATEQEPAEESRLAKLSA